MLFYRYNFKKFKRNGRHMINAIREIDNNEFIYYYVLEWLKRKILFQNFVKYKIYVVFQ